MTKTFAPSKETYEVTTLEEKGDIIIPLPPPLLKKLKWKEGDILQFSVDKDGRYIISKARNDNNNTHTNK
jgi:bifunctional DNA-binding transcriptional regulator/antitoxin component of YhaV-PrlF toxin-antitoxin module